MYNFKRLEEILWIGAIATGIFALQLAVDLDTEALLQDWKPYVIAAGGGLLRAFAGAILAARL